MNSATKSRKLAAPLIALAVVTAVVLVGAFAAKSIFPPRIENGIEMQKPIWQPAHSLLLQMDFEYKTDVFSVTEDISGDYPLSILAVDFGIYVHRIGGFAKSFIFGGTHSSEFYRLIGDSDLYKWQKSHKLEPSEPKYKIYVKDDAEHLKQEFSIRFKNGAKVPAYFPQGLKDKIASGQTTVVEAGNYYYISAEDIYMVHWVGPSPLPEETRALIDELVSRMKFGVGESQTSEEQSLKSENKGGERSQAENEDSPTSGRELESGGDSDTDKIDPLPALPGN
ncbi:MAG: hypothetical protein HRF49_12455 [bacterium]|jgi:hypothetical protein